MVMCALAISLNLIRDIHMEYLASHHEHSNVVTYDIRIIGPFLAGPFVTR